MAPRRPAPDLRLIAILGPELTAPRDFLEVVRACLAAGAPAVQLRDKRATARELVDLARALLPLTREAGALLFINDRLDVALAAGADGAHLGPTDLPIAAARSIVPPEFLLGHSTDDPEVARAAARAGADYIGCGAVFGTTSKPDAAGERIGPARLAEVVRAVDIPVVGIGGIEPLNVGQVAATGAAGAAVIRAITDAPEPGEVVRRLLQAFTR